MGNTGAGMYTHLEENCPSPSGCADPRPQVSPREGPEAPPERLTKFVQGRKVAFFVSVANLVAAMVGSGILGLGQVMARNGVALFFIMLTTFAVIVDYSLQLLVAASIASGTRTYEALGDHAMGRWGRWLAGAFVLIDALGAVTSYFRVFYDVIGGLLTSFGVSDDSPWASGKIVTVIACLCAVCPTANFVLRTQTLGVCSAIAKTCVCGWLLIVIIKVGQQGGHMATYWDDGSWESDCDGWDTQDKCGQVEWFSPSMHTLKSLPTLVFVFVCHKTVFPVYRELEAADALGRTYRARSRMAWVVHVTVLIAYVLFGLSATCSYLLFRGRAQHDILNNFSDWANTDRLSLASRLLFGIGVLNGAVLFPAIARLSFWGMVDPRMDAMYPGRAVLHDNADAHDEAYDRDDLVDDECGADEKQDSSELLPKAELEPYSACGFWSRHSAFTVTFIGAALLFALFVPGLGVIFDITGAISGTGLVLILPPIFYIRVCLSDKNVAAIRRRGSLRDEVRGVGSDAEYDVGFLGKATPWALLAFGVAVFCLSWFSIISDWVTNGFK